MNPPLALVCVNTTAQTHDHLYRGDHIGVSFLAHDQLAVARTFSVSGGDKFASVDWHESSGCGVPLLDGACAQLELEIEQRVPAGTHTVFVGRAIGAEVSGQAPLIYFDGSFFDGGRLSPST